MKTISVIGNFRIGQDDVCNGQTIKTRIVYKALVEKYGEKETTFFDTHGSKKKFLALPILLWKQMKSANNVIMITAHGGVKFVSPILTFLNLFYRRKLHYVVIGGWLPGFLLKHKFLRGIIRKFHHIYVETTTMKKALEDQGFKNVVVMPNCKFLDILNTDDVDDCFSEPLKLCTFSRVSKGKGIADAVYAVKKANVILGRTAYALDIYGQLENDEVEWFNELSHDFDSCIHYKGMVPFDQSVNVLKDYFALLFPTRFYTEGIPGTIIDAYAAGIPVISSKWESFSDVVEDGKTGYGFEFCNPESLTDILLEVAKSPQMIVVQKVNCLKKAYDYLPANVINLFEIGEST